MFLSVILQMGMREQPTLSLRRDEEAHIFARGRIFRGGFADLLSTIK